jgi:hypothetical protein
VSCCAVSIGAMLSGVACSASRAAREALDALACAPPADVVDRRRLRLWRNHYCRGYAHIPVGTPKINDLQSTHGIDAKVAQKIYAIYLLKRLADRVSRWWLGEFRPYKNDPDAAIVMLGGKYHRHWTADVAHLVVDSYLKHWQFIWTTGLAVVGLIIAALTIK